MRHLAPNSSALCDVDELAGQPVGGGPVTLHDLDVDARWERANSELLLIERLRDDWDGLGAKAPGLQVVKSAHILFRQLRRDQELPPPNAVSASPQGNIVFSWNQSGTYLEAEIPDAQRVVWLLELPNGESSMWTDIVTWDGQIEELSRESSLSLSRQSFINPANLTQIEHERFGQRWAKPSYGR
jgi:hypothetical protein